MAWIELHQGLPYNKKTLRLKRILRIKTAQAVGHVCMLWLWALDNAQDGDLTRFSAGGDCRGQRLVRKTGGGLRRGAAGGGLLDADRQIHDWHSYAGRLIEKRRADAERKRLMRERVREQAACPADVPAAGGAPAADSVRPARVTLPNPTEPYPTGHSAAAPGIAVGTALEERTGGADAPPASAGEAGSPGTASCDCRQPSAKPDGKAAASGGSREAGAPVPAERAAFVRQLRQALQGRLCETGDRAIGPAHAEKDGAAGEEGRYNASRLLFRNGSVRQSRVTSGCWRRCVDSTRRKASSLLWRRARDRADGAPITLRRSCAGGNLLQRAETACPAGYYNHL